MCQIDRVLLPSSGVVMCYILSNVTTNINKDLSFNWAHQTPHGYHHLDRGTLGFFLLRFSLNGLFYAYNNVTV